MQTATIEVTKEQAAEALKLYRQHVNTPGTVDWEIERIYRQIARGNKVIQAIESVKQAGVDDLGRPKLALIRADAQLCYFRREHTTQGQQAVFSIDNGWQRRKGRIEIDGFSALSDRGARAIVPHIPVHLRPKSDLSNYHILWEADWQDVPVDPMLLRRIGKGDAWVVLAAWDLTPVERAVLRARPITQ